MNRPAKPSFMNTLPKITLLFGLFAAASPAFAQATNSPSLRISLALASEGGKPAIEIFVQNVTKFSIALTNTTADYPMNGPMWFDWDVDGQRVWALPPGQRAPPPGTEVRVFPPGETVSWMRIPLASISRVSPTGALIDRPLLDGVEKHEVKVAASKLWGDLAVAPAGPVRLIPPPKAL